MKTTIHPIFAAMLTAADLPMPVAEYRFDPSRRWRFDYAWEATKVALEVEGGVWSGGRHTRGSGFVKDMTKYNRATVMGWRVVRCTPNELCTQATVDMLADLLRERGAA